MGTNHEDTHINESILSEEILEDQKKNRGNSSTSRTGKSRLQRWKDSSHTWRRNHRNVRYAVG